MNRGSERACLPLTQIKSATFAPAREFYISKFEPPGQAVRRSEHELCADRRAQAETLDTAKPSRSAERNTATFNFDIAKYRFIICLSVPLVCLQPGELTMMFPEPPHRRQRSAGLKCVFFQYQATGGEFPLPSVGLEVGMKSPGSH
jgi:hypothetical protein